MADMETGPQAHRSEARRQQDVLARVRERALLRKVDAREAMLAVLRALESWLTAGTARQLEAELPRPLALLLERHPPRRPVHPRLTHRDDFVSAVAGQLECTREEADRAIEAVFNAVRPELPQAEVERIASQLPPDLSELWLGAPQEAWMPYEEDEPAGLWWAFLDDLRASGRLPENREEEVSREILCWLESRLSGPAAAGLTAELPPRLRDLMTACQPARTHLATAAPGTQLTEHLRRRFSVSDEQAESMIRTVFALVREQITPGEAARISGQMPSDLREFWEHPAVAFTSAQDATDHLVTELKSSGATAPEQAEAAFTECLCALERRLSGGTARRLWDHLPPRMHDRVRASVPARAHPASGAGRREVLEWLAGRLDVDVGAAETTAREAFESLRRRLPDDVVRAVSAELPADLKRVWLNRPARPQNRRR